MKNGWQYVQNGGTSEKMAPMTLVENVLTSENGPSLKEAMPSNPNLLINGDFQVWQRGTSFTAAGYTADRWRMPWAGPTVSKISGGLRVQFSTAWCALQQEVETFLPAGTTITISTDVKSSAARQLAMWITVNGTAIEEYLMIDATTSYTKFSKTITIPTDATTLRVTLENTTTVTTDVDIRYIKAEIGEIATPNVPRPYAEELAMCKRYYEKMGPIHLLAPASLGFDQVFPFTVQKRVTPACKVYNVIGTPNKVSFWNDSNSWSDYDMSSLTDISQYGCRVGAALSTNRHFRFDLIADAEIY